jgi:hypothetical protein
MPDDSIPESSKRCTKCGRLLPKTTDFFYPRRYTNGKMALACWCKSCCSKIQHDHLRTLRLKKEAEKAAIPPEYFPGPIKQCSQCKKWSPAISQYFYRDPNHSDGFSPWCKICHEVHGKYYRSLHKERIAKQKKARYDENAEAERTRARQRRAANPEYGRQYRKEYRKRRPQVHKVGNEVRRTRKLGLPATFTPAEWQHALEYWHYACAVCGREEGFFWTLCADHWESLSSPTSPGTIASNMIPLCHTKKGNQQSCNNTKHDRDPYEWLIDRLGKRCAAKKLKEIEAYFASLRPRAVVIFTVAT